MVVAAVDVDYVLLGERDPTVDYGKRSGLQVNPIDASLDALESRHSIGWTDLDNALTKALEQAKDIPNTHIIYIGDGVQNTFDADPSAAAARMRTLYAKATADAEQPPTCHAVSLGSSYETVVMNAWASLGGGSTRNLKADEGPAKSALQLIHLSTSIGLVEIVPVLFGVSHVQFTVTHNPDVVEFLPGPQGSLDL